jgi:hypothetical protein
MSKISTTSSSNSNVKPPVGGNSRGRSTNRTNRVGSSSSIGRESGEENEEEDNTAAAASTAVGNEINTGEETEDGEKKENEEDDGNPKMRGSRYVKILLFVKRQMLIWTADYRCFEVLGFDIMIDNSLNPILIEVNHLPR